jgi:L-rhamnose mutarotase
MERIGFKMKINPAYRNEYLDIHKRVDMALVEEYRKLGVRNYAIYIDDDGNLFAFLECDDFAAYTNAVKNSPNQKAWGEKVYHMFGIKPDEVGGLVMLTEAFYMDQKTVTS